MRKSTSFDIIIKNARYNVIIFSEKLKVWI